MSSQGTHSSYPWLLTASRFRVRKGRRVPHSPSRNGDNSHAERSGVAARPFVGRERELAALIAGLEEAASGRGGLFLLSGGPGIGKTRLAEELADLAVRRGARALWGQAWEGGGQPAYWPWVQILR